MRRNRKLLLCLSSLVLHAILWSSSPAMGQGAHSEITVVDGDTLEIDGAIFQLYGIDAPELGQTCLDQAKRWRCGLQSAVELRGLISRWKNVECRRIFAEGTKVICHDSQFDDPAEVLLARGLAVTSTDSLPAYKRAEIEAKRGKIGVWRGDFVEPSEWRTGKRLTGDPDSPAEVCDIKGIITAVGNRVYYVPTDKNYEEIRVTADRGERMFCSDDEAELAGWKRYPRK